jgi:carboxylesterase
MIVGEHVDRNRAAWQTAVVPRPLPPPSARPFSLPPKHRLRARALCIHGYTGSPYEVLPLALALQERGVASEGIVLPGHEGDPSVLDRTTWQDWARAGEEAFWQLPADVPRFVVGSSMGALVALLIAAHRPDEVAGLVLLAPALRYFREGRLAALASQRGIWRLKSAVSKEREGGDVGDEEARRKNPSYAVLPIRGIGELGLMQAVVERELSRVRAPLCVLHGAQDHTIPLVASEIVARKVSSRRVEHHVLRDSWHVIGIDVDRDQIFDLASSFVDEIIEAAPKLPVSSEARS